MSPPIGPGVPAPSPVGAAASIRACAVRGFMVRDKRGGIDPARAVDLWQALGLNGAVVNILFPTVAKALQRAGVKVWTFVLPEKLDEGLGDDQVPDEWVPNFARMVEVALAEGYAGPLLNTERGWGGSTHSERGHLVDKILAAKDAGLDVGIGTHGGLARFVAGFVEYLSAAGVFVAPEFYHYGKGAPPDFWKVVLAQWIRMGWKDIRPFLGALTSDVRVQVGYFDGLEIGGYLWPSHGYHGAEAEAIKRWVRRILPPSPPRPAPGVSSR